jgi:hypothetical protein
MALLRRRMGSPPSTPNPGRAWHSFCTAFRRRRLYIQQCYTSAVQGINIAWVEYSIMHWYVYT